MIDMDDLVTRLLVYAEGSRRASKQEKDMAEALIHQNTALALDDAACHIKAQSIEMSRAGIAAIDSFQSQAARIERLKIVIADLLRVLDRIKEMTHSTTLGGGLRLRLKWIEIFARAEMELATDRMKETP